MGTDKVHCPVLAMPTASLFPIFFLLFSFPTLLNLSLEGTSGDLSDIVVMTDSGNGLGPVQFSVIDGEEGSWVLLNVSLPDESSSMVVLRELEGQAMQSSSQDSSFVEIPMTAELLPDLSNLVVQIVRADGGAETTGFSIVSTGDTFVVIHLDKAPGDGEQMRFFAGMDYGTPDIPAQNMTEPQENETVSPETEILLPPAENETSQSEPSGNETVSEPQEGNATQPENETIVPPPEEIPAPTNETEVGAENETFGPDVLDADQFMDIDQYMENVTAIQPFPLQLPAGFFKDFHGRALDAEIEFKSRGKDKTVRYDSRKEGKPELPSGKYDITIRPKGHPIVELHIKDFRLEDGSEDILDLDRPSPDSVSGPPGVKFNELYVVNPRADMEGSFTVQAKGSKVYKCVQWDFANRICLGEWVNVLNVTPGEYYTLDFNGADPAYGEGSDYFTLKNITLDGSFIDWDAVFANPHNVISDGIDEVNDPDNASIKTPNRDLILYAFTWNGDYFYSYFRRTAAGPDVAQMVLYIDVKNDGKLGNDDVVIKYDWKNNQDVDAFLYNYSNTTVGGDNITGDGQTEPGPTSGTGVQIETLLPGRGPTNIEMETRFNWSVIGLLPGQPFGMHISTTRGSGSLPGQIEDNLAPVNTSIIDISISPDNFGVTQNTVSVYYNHTVTNLGNYNDTVNINTTGTTPGYTINLTYANGTALTDTNADGKVDVGKLTPGQSISITVIITPQGASQGDEDSTYVVARSSVDANISKSAVDHTHIGALTIFPDRTGYVTNNTVIVYNHTITSFLANKTVNVQASSNNSWTVNLTYLNGTYLTDTNGDSILDVGNLTTGSSIGIYVRISVPASATVDTTDKTAVLASEAGNISVNSTVYDTTTIGRPIDIFPDRTGYVSLSGFIFYQHTVRNCQNFSDAADITNRSSQGWKVNYFADDQTTPLTDTNGNGIPDTGNLSAFGGERIIYVLISVYPEAANGTRDYTNITANSTRNSSVWDRVTDTTTAELLLTYSDAVHTNVSSLFYKTETVYARGSGLGNYTSKGVYFMWYDSNGTLLRTSPDLSVDANNISDDSLSLNTSMPSGTYIVYLHDAKNDATIAYRTFQVFGIANVTVVSPNGGEIWKSNRTIIYNVTDDSGKNVTATMQWSSNGGISWNDITTQQLNTTNCTGNPAQQCVQGQFNYTWDTTTVSDGTNYLIRVLANNTYFTGSDDSNAVFTIDNEPPVITLQVPYQPYTVYSSVATNVTFNCSATDDVWLYNISFHITNSTNQSMSLNSTANISGTSNASNWTLLLQPGNYTWTCSGSDRANNSAWAAENRTITFNTSAALAVYFTMPTPANNSNVTIYGIVLNFTSTSSMSTGNYIQIDGVNYSCTQSADNLSCAYALTYPQHIFNHTYSVIGFANVSGTYYPTNEIRVFNYYGCGIVNSTGTLISSVSITGSTCFTVNSSSVALNCAGYSVTGDGTVGTYGINITGYNQTNVSDCQVTGFNTGIYLNSSANSTLGNNTAYNNTNGFSVYGSANTTLSSNNATNNTAGGLILGGGADSTVLSSNYLCFNNRNDLNNSGNANSGSMDRCDYFQGWNETGYQGCTFTCSRTWHRFFGNASGQLLLSPKSDGTEIFYRWVWDGQKGKVYAINDNAAISWPSLIALGRNTSIQPSSNDFTELDSKLGSGSAYDSIANLYGSDGSNPLDTRNITMHTNTVYYVPVANSSLQSAFKTGIAWDSSQSTNSEFDATDNEDVVFVAEINGTAPYQYDIRVPGTFDTYKGGSGVVQFWVEME